MVKEVVKTKKKEGTLKHCQEIITKVNEKVNFRNEETKSLINEQFNLYEKLKGMEEVMHQ